MTEGRLPARLPYLRLGQGPPLVMALGRATEHANPAGAGRRLSLVTAGKFGSSAGGAVGLELAIGYPHLVRRLVLAAAACRLSPSGRQLLAEVARLVKAGDSRQASALVAKALAPRLLRHPAGALAEVV